MERHRCSKPTFAGSSPVGRIVVTSPFGPTEKAFVYGTKDRGSSPRKGTGRLAQRTERAFPVREDEGSTPPTAAAADAEVVEASGCGPGYSEFESRPSPSRGGPTSTDVWTLTTSLSVRRGLEKDHFISAPALPCGPSDVTPTHRSMSGRLARAIISLSLRDGVDGSTGASGAPGQGSKPCPASFMCA
jgi:hypothetical protein